MHQKGEPAPVGTGAPGGELKCKPEHQHAVATGEINGDQAADGTIDDVEHLAVDVQRRIGEIATFIKCSATTDQLIIVGTELLIRARPDTGNNRMIAGIEFDGKDAVPARIRKQNTVIGGIKEYGHRPIQRGGGRYQQRYR